MTIRNLILLFILLGLIYSQTLKIHLQENSDGRRNFIDSSGRERIFHGVNAVVKGPPWVPETEIFNVDSSLSEKDFELLDSLGLNIIRLGTMWPGVEPSEGRFNETYINELQKISAMAKKYGMYILLDMHQDVLSEKFCGEGVPAFAANDYGLLKFPEPLGKPFTEMWDREFEFPARKECRKYDWGNLQFSQAAGSAYQSLYKNYEYLKKWGRFWVKVTESFKNQSEIIGVELINEPWAGDTVNNPLLLLPGVADKQNLQQAYDYLSEQIWGVDEDMLVFFAGVTWDDFSKAGFKSAPGGKKNSKKSVFAFHYYEPPQYNLEPYVKTRIEDSIRLNTGTMLTETGNPTMDKEHLQRLEVWDKNHLSWISWEYKSFCITNYTTDYQQNITQWDQFGSCKTGYGGNLWNRNGTENEQETRAFARSYPRAIAGKLVDMIFNPETSDFTVRWVANTQIKEPTELFISERFYYQNGYEIDIQPFGSIDVKKPKINILHLNYHDDTIDKQVITVKIMKNQQKKEEEKL